MTELRSHRQRADLRRLILAVIVIGGVTGVMVGIARTTGIAPVPLVFGLGGMLGGAMGFWWAKQWWDGADEAVREAHKSGWFWGGSAGMIAIGGVATVLYGVIMEPILYGPPTEQAAEWFGLTPREAGLMLVGVVATVALQLIGYGLFWAGWWLNRRR